MLDPVDARAAGFGVMRTAGRPRSSARSARLHWQPQGPGMTVVPVFRSLAARTLPHVALTLWLENRAGSVPKTTAAVTSGPARFAAG